ncbi:MAG: hypothetical protein JSR61_04435 [Proteobacteria bacterium]|nr:hypothetical protein [Pseudomonadota bacterium]
MSVEIVNGYVCRNCEEAAKAKQGKDPHAKPGDSEKDAQKDKLGGYADQPATVLDGALKGLLSANPVTATQSSAGAQVTASATTPPAVDRLA